MEAIRSKPSGSGKSTRTWGPRVIFADAAKAKDRAGDKPKWPKGNDFRPDEGQRRENERSEDQKNNAGSKVGVSLGLAGEDALIFEEERRESLWVDRRQEIQRMISITRRYVFGCHIYLEEAEEYPGNKEHRYRCKPKADPRQPASTILSKREQSSCQPHKKANYGEIGSDSSGEEKQDAEPEHRGCLTRAFLLSIKANIEPQACEDEPLARQGKVIAGSQNEWRCEREERARERRKQAIFEDCESYLVSKEGLENVVRESRRVPDTEKWTADALRIISWQPRRSASSRCKLWGSHAGSSASTYSRAEISNRLPSGRKPIRDSSELDLPSTI